MNPSERFATYFSPLRARHASEYIADPKLGARPLRLYRQKQVQSASRPPRWSCCCYRCRRYYKVPEHGHRQWCGGGGVGTEADAEGQDGRGGHPQRNALVEVGDGTCSLCPRRCCCCAVSSARNRSREHEQGSAACCSLAHSTCRLCLCSSSYPCSGGGGGGGLDLLLPIILQGGGGGGKGRQSSPAPHHQRDRFRQPEQYSCYFVVVGSECRSSSRSYRRRGDCSHDRRRRAASADSIDVDIGIDVEDVAAFEDDRGFHRLGISGIEINPAAVFSDGVIVQAERCRSRFPDAGEEGVLGTGLGGKGQQSCLPFAPSLDDIVHRGFVALWLCASSD